MNIEGEPYQPQTMDELFSAVSNGSYETPEAYTYRGYPIISINGLWTTRIQKEDGSVIETRFRFQPNETLEVQKNGSLSKDAFNTNLMVISIDPYYPNQSVLGIAGVELGGNLFKSVNAEIHTACSVNTTDGTCEGRLIASCNNTIVPTFEFYNEGPTRIELDDKCIQFYGEDLDVIKAVDRYLYEWYGIIKN